jgi:hypothetical protein
MILTRLLPVILSPLYLCHCYYTPQGVGAWTPQQQAYQSDVRQFDQQMQQRAYQSGAASGEADRRAGVAPNYRRYTRLYNQASERAFSDGYQRGYQQARVPYNQPIAPRPQTGGLFNPFAPSQPTGNQATLVYNKGYDYGMRDRAARRPRDPGSHMANMQPWERQAFERGYIDAYNALPNR